MVLTSSLGCMTAHDCMSQTCIVPFYDTMAHRSTLRDSKYGAQYVWGRLTLVHGSVRSLTWHAVTGHKQQCAIHLQAAAWIEDTCA
jgi:hypothetical protein